MTLSINVKGNGSMDAYLLLSRRTWPSPWDPLSDALSRPNSHVNIR